MVFVGYLMDNTNIIYHSIRNLPKGEHYLRSVFTSEIGQEIPEAFELLGRSTRRMPVYGAKENENVSNYISYSLDCGMLILYREGNDNV